VKRPAEWLRAITRHRATISFAPNFAYDLCVRRIKDRDLEGLDLSSWRIAGCGAEPIHAPTLDAFAEKFAPVGFRASSFVASYGLAEHVVAATFAPLNRPPRVDRVDADDLTDHRVARAASGEKTMAVVGCGKPFPDHRIRIIGEDGREQAERHVGEITLSGPSVMVGYYRDSAQTDRTIRDGWLHTGDLGFVMDGELFVAGRRKEMIVVQGRNFFPDDVESAARVVPGVHKGHCVAIADTEAESIVVVAESALDDHTALTTSIRGAVSRALGLSAVRVLVVPPRTLPRTTSGKWQRALVSTVVKEQSHV
jgi:acyl-CoA synthetase (AMP-forming)/AMP-acid ligase II